MTEIDPINDEIRLVKKLFNLDEIIDFQSQHHIQIIREEDYNYMCYIYDEDIWKCFGSSLTTFGALVIGIHQFKKSYEQKNSISSKVR